MIKFTKITLVENILSTRGSFLFFAAGWPDFIYLIRFSLVLMLSRSKNDIEKKVSSCIVEGEDRPLKRNIYAMDFQAN